MSGGPTRADQGLFETHFAKGRELFEQRRFAEAEAELEEAYLLKPREPQVLNLLGIVYFKQEKLARAEEIYLKLLAESPEAHTLYYNLGLIYMKLGRLEEAEPAFLKALELAADNPKIHYYLGAIYERMQRYQDAIYRYRQAGASLMVKRVEDLTGAPGGRKRRDDTAEFAAKQVHEALQQLAAGVAPPKKVEPVSPRLLATGSPAVTSSDTARFKLKKPDDTARFKKVTTDTDKFTKVPRPETLPPEAIRVPAAPDSPALRPPDHTGPVTVFRLLGNGLIEAVFSGKLFIKQGTIYSYSGNLTFWVKEPRGYAPAPLVIVTGNGRLILTDKDREIALVQVKDEVIHVDPRHVLAADEGLVPTLVRFGEGDGSLEFLQVEGRGTVALSVTSRPLALTITPDLPASVPVASLIYWSGSLAPQFVQDADVYAVMGTSVRPGSLLRLEGSGQLMVEQWLG